MAALYDKLIRRVLFGFSAETAHEIGISALRIGLASDAAQRIAGKRYSVDSLGPLERFGLLFRNPLGIAAGFDKNGIVVNQLASLGFGFVEVGTVTFNPQPGNVKPRLFRLPEDSALINRLGFNNEGARAVVGRLKRIRPKCVLGINIGKNKDVPNDAAIENYLASFDLVHEIADYIAVNVSSPNTPDLRALQRSENLEELLSSLQSRNSELAETRGNRVPLLVKIAPDLAEADIEAIADICLRLELSGIIATNTTVSREDLRTAGAEKYGSGGLSGRPLFKRSNEVIRLLYQYTRGRLPIVGVGGIFTSQDAFEKIAAGASLVQAYTGFIYSGLSFARDVNEGLERILHERGFSRLDDAVGSGAGPRGAVPKRRSVV